MRWFHRHRPATGARVVAPDRTILAVCRCGITISVWSGWINWERSVRLGPAQFTLEVYTANRWLPSEWDWEEELEKSRIRERKLREEWAEKDRKRANRDA